MVHGNRFGGGGCCSVDGQLFIFSKSLEQRISHNRLNRVESAKQVSVYLSVNL